MRAAHQASSLSGRVHHRGCPPAPEGGVKEREVTICASVFETRQQQCAWVERSPQWAQRDLGYPLQPTLGQFLNVIEALPLNVRAKHCQWNRERCGWSPARARLQQLRSGGPCAAPAEDQFG